MKKALAIGLSALMALGIFAGCSKTASSTSASKTASASASKSAAASGSGTSITLWTYPIGSWGDAKTVDGIIAEFNKKNPDIKVKVEYLDYKTGDDQVTSAIEAKTTPDVIMEGPERLVANWGAKGKMVDLKDLWTADATKDIQATTPVLVSACTAANGAKYEYPLAMTTHTMAINYDVFKKANALQYLDEKTHTWTTENFAKALKAVKDSGLVQETGIVYCGGQGGDQGTRALAMNLYSAKFTNDAHTEWTMNSDKGIKGLQQLVDWKKQGIIGADAGIVAGDELQLFANGTIAMTLAWNPSNQATYASQVAFTPFTMAFPSDDGVPELAGGIYGFGIFNNGDEARIAAAKKFISFVCDDATQGPASVKATKLFPARASFGNIYKGADNEASQVVFGSLQKYLGDYYNVAGGWAEQRTAWWNMLQKIFSGTDVTTAANDYVKTCNDATAAAAKK